MTIKPGMPYKIAPLRVKKYAAHYHISPERCLIVPMKILGNEASCDIRWEDDNGELFLLQNKFFVCENLLPMNAMLEPKLHELWQHYYPADVNTTSPSQPDQENHPDFSTQ